MNPGEKLKEICVGSKRCDNCIAQYVCPQIDLTAPFDWKSEQIDKFNKGLEIFKE